MNDLSEADAEQIDNFGLLDFREKSVQTIGMTDKVACVLYAAHTRPANEASDLLSASQFCSIPGPLPQSIPGDAR